MDLSFKNQHVFLNSGFLKPRPHPQKHHCSLKVPRTAFSLGSPAYPHKGPRPQNSTKNKYAHTETAPPCCGNAALGTEPLGFRKVFLRPIFCCCPLVCPGVYRQRPWPLGFVVVKLSGHGLVAWNTAAWGCSSARWTHGSTLSLRATPSSVGRAQDLP